MNNPRKVLLVENDEFTRYMMREIIVALGVDVEIAEDGQASIDMLSSAPNEYGLVLMDLHMPRLSGIEATQQIREAPMDPPSSVPIIAVTADAAYHDDTIVKDLGMNGFAPKPVTPGQILNLIDKFCAAA
ncbi:MULTISPECIES: response regulator [unclassified Leisingera]|uniref:response regulator n=1 Tax=unclassified Leisingera TaxID=2614906 RepID=UPI000366131F|nr:MULTISPECIES: response regulator [unclassified Leisingera]KIC18372.1 response regulator [Leisingera sp. ANG-DT]KIC24202.1 response regulator [Leisingera sp. ANG-S3]KIC26989.1 response regulator [Leisingera sp. ANG-M6]KIC33040.1 response regulator [Leisingera sp. ANG-S5]KIC52918.1 response regulator [Leisingera sp. ANG-S]